MPLFAGRRAEALHRKAMQLDDAGDEDGALAHYIRALALDPNRPTTLYNIGLIHKYRRAWDESYRYNRRAYELRPDDEATRWNLGIAATALRDWSTAREVWRLCGFDLDDGDGPVDAPFGRTPVRLHPDAEAEVVWAERIDPVRGRIVNIPFPESDYYFGDVVLHDGAATGYRMSGDQQRPVFNVFERFERSDYSTAVAEVTAPSQTDVDALSAACEAAGLVCEDWTETTEWLCKQCSEGAPHDHHDADLPDPVWRPEHRLGFAVTATGQLEPLLQDWAASPGRAVRRFSDG